MSLLDQPQAQLNSALFDADDRMLPSIRKYIFDDINTFMPFGTIYGVYLLGSMAGRQYNSQSDIDINIVTARNIDRETYKYIGKERSNRNLPGTEHPINYHLQAYSEPNYKDNSEYAVYDLVQDMWLVPPKLFGEIRDPNNEFRDELRYARMYSRSDFQHDLLEKNRKQVYSFGWGTPRESQQNILYKLIEKLTSK